MTPHSAPTYMTTSMQTARDTLRVGREYPYAKEDSLKYWLKLISGTEGDDNTPEPQPEFGGPEPPIHTE